MRDAVITATFTGGALTVQDKVITGLEDTSITVDLETLTSSRSPISFDTEGTPANGTLTQSGSTLTYVPDADFFGTDSIVYIADDGTTTESATITFEIQSVIDAPIARDESFPVTEDSSVTIDLANLLTGDAVDGIVPTNGQLGSFTVSGTILVYTPDPDVNGTDTITYTATNSAGSSNAVLTLVIDPVNDSPVTNDESVRVNPREQMVIPFADLLANDSPGPDNEQDQSLTISEVSVADDSNGTVEILGNTVVFTPDSDFTGVDSFQYTVEDSDGASAIAAVTVSVEFITEAV